jgi:hypothetical protein
VPSIEQASEALAVLGVRGGRGVPTEQVKECRTKIIGHKQATVALRCHAAAMIDEDGWQVDKLTVRGEGAAADPAMKSEGKAAHASDQNRPRPTPGCDGIGKPADAVIEE